MAGIASVLSGDGDGEEEGGGGLESADVVRSLDKMKALLKDQPIEIQTQFAAMEIHEARAWLQGTHRGNGGGNVSGNGVKSLVDAFARLLKRHGHRCIKEAELRQADWGTDPTPLVRLLQSTTRAQLPRGKDGKAGKGGKGVKGVKGGKSGDKGGKRGKSGGTAAAAGGNHQGRGKPGSKLKAYLASHPHLGCCARRLLVWAIKRARSGVHRREMGKSLQVEAHSIVKRAFRALGRALALEGTLPDFDLVYFLTYDELGRVCRMRGTGTPLTEGQTRTLVKSALQRRRLLPRQEAMHFDDLGQVSRCRKPSFLV